MAPEYERVALVAPIQIAGGAPKFIFGNAFTVTVMLLVPVQPLISVTVNVNGKLPTAFVVNSGLTML